MGLKERRAREKDERKKQVLAAARTLLFEKGLHATSINLIAKTAELGVGTIYSYFRSKEEIFSFLQEEGLEILYRRIEAVGRTGETPEEKLRLTADIYLWFSENHKNYFDIINYFLSSPQIMLAPDLKQRVDRQGQKILALIVDFIEKGASGGQFKGVEPRKCAVMFWAALHGLVQIKKLQPTILQGDRHQEIFNYAVDHMIRGFRGP